MNNPQNLLIITVSPFPFGTASANLLRLLSKGLKANGYNVNLLIQRGQTNDTYCNIGLKEGEIDGINYRYCGFTKKPNSSYKKVIDIIKGIIIPFIYIIRHRHKIDYVLTYNNYFYEDILNIIACKVCRIKIFHYDVDWYNKESIVKSFLNLPKWYSYLAKKYFLSKRYNGLIVISNYLKDFYIKQSIKEEKILLLPNLIDVADFNSKHVYDKPKAINIRIGYSGGALFLNGVDDLIRAFKIVHNRFPATELLIVGDVAGGVSEIPLLKEIAKKNSIDQKVIFTGRVSGEKIPEYLLSCDILVLARKSSVFAQAGFPTKLGEYFNSKKPVIITEVGDITEYFTHEKELLIAEPDNPKSIADNIIYLIENPNIGKIISENGYQWAKHNLEYISASKKVADFISNDIF